MVEYYEARVLFDYDPVNVDELRLREGESIEVRVGPDIPCEEGWLAGSNIRGQHGVFPASYVADATQHPTSTGPQREDGNLVHAQHGNEDCTTDHVLGVAPIGTLKSPGDDASGLLLENYGDAAETTEHGDYDDGRSTVVGSTATLLPSSKSDVDPSIRGSALEPNSQQRQVPCAGKDDGGLPEGWYSATDEATGIEYYYTDDGQSSWVKPTAALEPSGGLAAKVAAKTPQPNSANDEPAAKQLGGVGDTYHHGAARRGDVDVMASAELKCESRLEYAYEVYTTWY